VNRPVGVVFDLAEAGKVLAASGFAAFCIFVPVVENKVKDTPEEPSNTK